MMLLAYFGGFCVGATAGAGLTLVCLAISRWSSVVIGGKGAVRGDG